MKITAVIGSYRRDGFTRLIAEELLAAARAEGAQVRLFDLLDCRIEFCRNCQACCQAPGEQRGECPIDDDMAAILDAIDESDAVVLASPMNFWTVTALMKRFIERLICYGDWPWTSSYPRNRIKRRSKRAVVIGCSAAPAVMTKHLSGMNRLLRSTAKLLGASKVKSLFVGLVRANPATPAVLPPRVKARAAKLGRELAR